MRLGKGNGAQLASRKKAQTRPALRKSAHPAVAKLAVALSEHKEALEQQGATAEILRAMSKSPGDAQPVFEAIVEKAHRLCRGAYTVLYRYDGKLIHLVAAKEVNAKAMQAVRGRYPQQPDRNKMVGRAILERKVLHTADIGADSRFPAASKIILRRAVVCVPLMRDGAVLGVISCGRAQAKPFAKKEIWLLKTFADQAVMAIENARLFHATNEALERQTATAEILKVISSSPTDVQPVFDAIAKNSLRLLGGFSAAVARRVGDELHLASFTSTSRSGDKALKDAFPMPLSSSGHRILAQAVLVKSPVHVADTQARGVPPRMRDLGRARGYRSALAVPLIHDGEAIGTISVTRREPGAFSNHHFDLLKTFADQAVIAIENVRLFNETKEALEHQKASGDVLRIVAGSIESTDPVFEAISAAGMRLMPGSRVALLLVRDGKLHYASHSGIGEERRAALAKFFPMPLDAQTASGTAILEKRIIHIPDINAGTGFELTRKVLSHTSGFRAMLAVPLIRKDNAIGALNISRETAGPFSEKEIALAKTFADQAVIAIENARLFNETKEALEQQTATSEVLGVISRSPTDLQPVFDAILRSAAELCEAHLGLLNLCDGERLRTVAQRGGNAEFAKWVFERGAFKPDGEIVLRTLAEGRPFQIADVRQGSAYLERRPNATKFADLGGVRTFLSVPLLKHDKVIGNIGIYRPEVRPFTEKQVALVTMFANQAVIAIENVRLFNETKQALEQQTGTAEILKVISSSPTDTQPVFDIIANRAVKLCDAEISVVSRFDGELIHLVASHGVNEQATEIMVRIFPMRPGDETVMARTVRNGALVHVADVLADPLYSAKDVAAAAQYRSSLGVPMMRAGEVIGAIFVGRTKADLFSDKQVALMQTFADQAAIAIENARLFNETKEALERQTATAEILRVISRSPADVQPVFDAIARSAVKLCGGMFGAVFRYDGEQAHFVAHHGFSVEALELMQRRFPRVPQGLLAPTLLDCAVSHSPDVLSDSHSANPELSRALGYRGFLGVPMLLDSKPIGSIVAFRRETGPFSDAQIAVLQTFADQAVIAIENVRLFNETKEALERQTATAEILKVISSSPTDEQPVFDAIVNSAARLFGRVARIRLVDGDKLALRAASDRAAERSPLPITPDSVGGRIFVERRALQVADIDAADAPVENTVRGRATGYRAIASAPLMREDEVIGVIGVLARDPGALSEKEMALLQTFADQAVIAIENVRLFRELQTRNRALTEALDQQTATGEILKTISSATSEVQPVFDTIVRNAVRLCDGAYGALFTYDGKLMDIGAQSAYGTDTEALEMMRRQFPRPASREIPSAHAIFERTVINVADILESGYSEAVKERARAQGWRSVLTLPMMRDETPIGALSVVRRERGVFGDSYIALLKTFAAQAVIAIENVRLFNEINEALRLQTSTADVLKTISRSTFDLDAVLQALLDNATKLSGAARGIMLRPDPQGNYVPAFSSGYPADSPLVERMRERPIRPDRGSINGRVLLEKKPIHVPDVLADPEYRRGDLAKVGGFRTVLSVPMLRYGEAMGLIGLTKGAEVDPFTDKQMELVTTFADQAVIAIENVRLFREIEEKSQQLEVANKHKSDFLANMSHELRTPLNAIIGFSEALMDRMFGELNEKQFDYLKDIHESGKHLLSLINDILDLSKIEAGRMELDLSSFHLPTAISNAMTLIRERAQRHGVALEQDVDSRIGEFTADERKVKQILLNLLSNAVKFTPESGRVEVSAKLDTDHVEIAVRDTGVGISPEDQSSLFEEFRQVGKDSGRKAEGTGLGLALTKRFVELHGGAIRVDSAQGKGSTFTFSLPVRQ